MVSVEMEERQKMGNQGHIQSFFGDNIFWHHILHFVFLIQGKSQKLMWHAKLELDMPSVKENINEFN